MFKLIFMVMIFLVSCSATQPDSLHTYFSPRQIAEIIISEQANMPSMHYLTPEDDLFWEFLSTRYRIDTNETEITDGIIFYVGGVYATEIAILLLADKTDAVYIGDLLAGYMYRRRSVFGGYAPTQAALLGNSIVSIHENHVALLITEEARSAEATFLSCFGNNPPDLPEESTFEIKPAESVDTEASCFATLGDIYDPISILLAWNLSDPSALTEMNRRIFDKCVYVISLLITDDMDDFEKQMAVHDWIIDWAVFDEDFFDGFPNAEANPNSYNPYGVLFNQAANCFGFSYTFQLFMNLLGFECITVHGTNFTGGKHAWNLIQIAGVWYAVDTTWNNPVDFPRENRPRSVTHRFFNVTGETLFFYGHRWDRDSVPEATGSRPVGN